MKRLQKNKQSTDGNVCAWSAQRRQKNLRRSFLEKETPPYSSCGNKMSSHQMQGNKRTINDAEGRTLLNSLIETPCAPENTPKRRWKKNFLVAHSQDSTPKTALNVSENSSTNEEVVHKHPDLSILKPPSRSDGFRTGNNVLDLLTSTNEEVVHKHPDLSILKPPSRSDGFRTGNNVLDLLKMTSSMLISKIKEGAVDANEMIDISSKSFEYLDSIGADYTPVYNAVLSVIRHHVEKESLAKRRPHRAFDTKAAYDHAALEFSEAEERYNAVTKELKDAEHDTDGSIARLNDLHDEIKKAEEEKEKNEAKLAAVQAVKVTTDEVYSKAKSTLEKTAPNLCEAQMAVDDYERRRKETKDGLDHAMKELLRLKDSL
ncbi:hypothetical protein HanIR_Chr03g0141661 [Helianthus annuus]|nr:hypothetical protein HanIR_Chr03g0141661 [Helianthus annuus]